MSPAMGIVIGIIMAAVLIWAAYCFYWQRQAPLRRKGEMRKSQPLPAMDAGEKYDLPAGYDTDEIVAMAKDPEWLYAYWEVTAGKQEEFAHQFGPGVWEVSQPVIRVYDITGNVELEQAGHHDVAINDQATSWYLYLGLPDHTLILDLGRVLPDGRFVTLARSKTVTLPANAPSRVIDPNWPPIGALWPHVWQPEEALAGTSPRHWPFGLGISSPQMIRVPEETR
ncbi:MAG: DUF4912 domain-containing protein [Clostridia bacterium]|nr:MAG: DUF4912 domain-containing protein [Clostridia bacterium]